MVARVSVNPGGASASAPGAATMRVSWSPLSSNRAAAAISMISVSGGSAGAKTSGGSVLPSAKVGVAADAFSRAISRAARVSGATRVCHGGVRKSLNDAEVLA